MGMLLARRRNIGDNGNYDNVVMTKSADVSATSETKEVEVEKVETTETETVETETVEVKKKGRPRKVEE